MLASVKVADAVRRGMGARIGCVERTPTSADCLLLSDQRHMAAVSRAGSADALAAVEHPTHVKPGGRDGQPEEQSA